MITNMAAISAFKPSKQESKAQTTDAAARAISDAEAAKREAKTLRLRAARLKAEAETSSDPAVEPKRARARKR